MSIFKFQPTPERVTLSTTNTQKQTKSTIDSVKKWTHRKVNRWMEDNNLPRYVMRHSHASTHRACAVRWGQIEMFSVGCMYISYGIT